MSDLEQAARLALELRQLANKFSEGWHDGIKIDASDVMLLADAAAALEQAEPVVFTDAAIEAALAEWFGEGRNDGSGFEGRMRAAIKAACDFKEAK